MPATITRLTWSKPRRQLTDFGKRRTWLAHDYMIFQTGEHPYVCAVRYHFYDSINECDCNGFKPFSEHRTLKAAQRVCQQRAKREGE